MQPLEPQQLPSRNVAIDVRQAAALTAVLRAPFSRMTHRRGDVEQQLRPSEERHQIGFATMLCTHAWQPLFAQDGLGLNLTRCLHISQSISWQQELAVSKDSAETFLMTPTLRKVRRRSSHVVVELDVAVHHDMHHDDQPYCIASTVLWIMHEPLTGRPDGHATTAVRDAVAESTARQAILQATDLARYAELSGDDNPIHRDLAAAQQLGFSAPIAHGMMLLGLAGQRLADEHADQPMTLLQGRFVRPLPVTSPGTSLQLTSGPDASNIDFQLNGACGAVVDRACVQFAS